METVKTEAARSYKCAVRFEKKYFLLLQLVVAGMVLIAGSYFSAGWYWLVITGLLVEVASIAVMWWPVIEPVNGVVRERALLVGKKWLSETVTPLNEFTKIFYEYVPNETPDTKYPLGLRHKTGRKIWVEGHGITRLSVEATAWEIACRTGIKLNEWPA